MPPTEQESKNEYPIPMPSVNQTRNTMLGQGKEDGGKKVDEELIKGSIKIVVHEPSDIKVTITQKTLGIQGGHRNIPESTTVITLTIIQNNKPRSAAASGITAPVPFMILGLATSEAIPPEVVAAFVLWLWVSLVVKFVKWVVGRMGERGCTGSVV